jgi:hypothetical protein
VISSLIRRKENFIWWTRDTLIVLVILHHTRERSTICWNFDKVQDQEERRRRDRCIWIRSSRSNHTRCGRVDHAHVGPLVSELRPLFGPAQPPPPLHQPAAATMFRGSSASVFLGVDVGTGSARAGIFDQKGKLLGSASSPIQIWKEKDCIEVESCS